jgi:hypothetical protein
MWFKNSERISVSDLADYSSSPNDFLERKRRGINKKALSEGNKYHVQVGVKSNSTITLSKGVIIIVICICGYFAFHNL